MKKNLLFQLSRLFVTSVVIVASLAAVNARAAVTLPFYDPFSTNYVNGARLADIPALDAGNGGGSGSNLTNSWSVGLTYSGLVNSNELGGVGGVIANGTPSGNRDRGYVLSPLSPTAGTNIYASFLLKIVTPTTTTNLIAMFANGTGGVSTPAAGVYLDQDNKLRLSKNSVVPPAQAITSSALGTDSTNLIVFRYRAIAGTTNDEVALWINPDQSYFGQLDETTLPAPSITNALVAGNSDPNAIQSVQLSHRSSGGIEATGFKILDEVRIATNWAGVTPAAVCSPASITGGPSPASGTVFAGNSITFTLTNSSGLERTYQWQTNGGSGYADATGATSSSYTSPALSTGTFKARCVVSVACGGGSAATSTEATISVLDGSTYKFQSKTSGNWNDTNTWEMSTDGINWSGAISTPSSANNTITVVSSHTVTVSASVAIDETTIQSGATVDVTAGTLTINNGAASVDCDVFGLLQASGGSVTNAGAGLNFTNNASFKWNAATVPVIPSATWGSGTTCEVANSGGANPTTVSGMAGQSFGNFVWSSAATTASVDFFLGNGATTTVQSNLTLHTGGGRIFLDRTNPVGGTVNILGNVLITGTTAAGTSKVLLAGNVGGQEMTINVKGDFVVDPTGGLDVGSGTGNAKGSVYFTGTAPQLLGIAPGTLNNSTRYQWTVNASATVLLTNGNLAVNSPTTFTNSGSFHFGTNQLTGNGTFTFNSGGTIVGNGTNQLITGAGTVNYGGNLNLPSLPTDLANGNSFVLFGAAAYNGLTFSGITPATTPVTGLTWSQSLLNTSGALLAGTGGGPTPGLPYITSILKSGTDVIISGTNGTVNGTYHVLATNNVAATKTTWPSILTNNFDSNGNFIFTNAIGSSPLFYLIQQQ